MTIIKKSIKINSNSSFEIIDITDQVKEILNNITQEYDDKIPNKTGIVSIFTKHSTSAIRVNENESGLLTDFENILNELVLDKNNYRHDAIDNNASSHLKSFLLGSSESIPISEGKLDLGTWQSIFFIELDGPRMNRTVDLNFILE
ncbi:secondary thiamine-phosphate synthase enzyme YjbQ [uncultured Methanobrevibacter sp.]|uniref:secondary thiamine-phosphate synthase enzyme YjbQ n=1 Tax=uncultured Methanobrevibacter sp. TaxID=253161 RepID=UPI00261E50EA